MEEGIKVFVRVRPLVLNSATPQDTDGNKETEELKIETSNNEKTKEVTVETKLN